MKPRLSRVAFQAATISVAATACLVIDNIIAAVNRATRTTPPNTRWPDRRAP